MKHNKKLLKELGAAVTTMDMDIINDALQDLIEDSLVRLDIDYDEYRDLTGV